SADPALTASFADGKSVPRTVIIVTVESAYFHCAKAIHRSKLWDASSHVAAGTLPSPNAILAAIQWQRCRRGVGLGVGFNRQAESRCLATGSRLSGIRRRTSMGRPPRGLSVMRWTGQTMWPG